MLYIYYIHIYVIICNSNVDYTILYDKEKKNVHVYLYFVI